MTLLITVFAAIISTILWYRSKDNEMRLETLCFLFWGASFMWLGDAIWEYAELREAYFTPDAADLLNDAFLGLSVVALALIVWLVVLLLRDPKGRVRNVLGGKKTGGV